MSAPTPPNVDYGNIMNHRTAPPIEMEASWQSGAGFTRPYGSRPAFSMEATVVDVNTTAWTVDVKSVFENKFERGVQVACPYLDQAGEAGMYAMPEVGTKCMLEYSSEGTPKIMGFIASLERVSTVTKETPAGTNSTASKASTVGGAPSFAAGRSRGKPGDIVLRGRDGNFVLLHRGGVLQVGASQLAQRICIPLGNIITDICETFNQFTSAGSVHWGIREIGGAGGKLVGENTQVYRVYADTAYADIRLKVGKCSDLVPEPADGDAATIAGLGIKDADSYVELVIAGNGFESDNGKVQPSAQEEQVFRFIIDKHGGLHLRTSGAIHVHTKKRMLLEADEGFELRTPKDVTITAAEGLRIGGGKSLSLGTDGGTVTVNGGSQPIASVGSTVKVLIPPGTPFILTGLVAGTIPVTGVGILSAPVLAEGSVTTGNPTTLV